MKNFQANLLICLALGLCALCVWQWYGQTRQRTQIEKLNQLLYEKSAAIQSYTNSISTMDHQIAQMDAQITSLKASAKSNEDLVVTQKRELGRSEAESAGFTNQIAQYQKAVGALEAKLKEASEGIQKQNESLKKLVTQRDEFVQKLNDSVRERNDIVSKYNDLAERLQKQQAGGVKQ